MRGGKEKRGLEEGYVNEMCLILGWSACFIDLNGSIDQLVNYDEFKMVWGSSVVEFLRSQ